MTLESAETKLPTCGTEISNTCVQKDCSVRLRPSTEKQAPLS